MEAGVFTLSHGCLSLKIESWTLERSFCGLVDGIGLLFAVSDGIGVLLRSVIGVECAVRGGEFEIASLGW